jgi:hypothetical protein
MLTTYRVRSHARAKDPVADKMQRMARKFDGGASGVGEREGERKQTCEVRLEREGGWVGGKIDLHEVREGPRIAGPLRYLFPCLSDLLLFRLIPFGPAVVLRRIFLGHFLHSSSLTPVDVASC